MRSAEGQDSADQCAVPLVGTHLFRAYVASYLRIVIEFILPLLAKLELQ